MAIEPNLVDLLLGGQQPLAPAAPPAADPLMDMIRRATAPTPEVDAVEPDPIGKGRLLGLILTDALSKFGANRAGRPAPPNVLEQLRARREQRAFDETQEQRGRAEREATSGRTQAQTELQVELSRRGRAEQRDINREAAGLATERQQTQMDFQAQQAELNMAHNERLATMRSADPRAAEALEAKMLQARQVVAGLRGNIQEELKNKTPQQLREEYELTLEVLGIEGDDKLLAMSFFEKWVSPMFPKPSEPKPRVDPRVKEKELKVEREKAGQAFHAGQLNIDQLREWLRQIDAEEPGSKFRGASL